MRLLFLIVTALLALPAGAQQGGPHRAGEFDYYVMALSWSPGWCATEARPGEEQCRPGRRRSFVLHGLWPQYEEGWPSDCRTGARDPSRAQSAAMADIMGSAGLAWYQWKKHGRCSGLSGPDYYATARRAFASVRIPEVFQKLDRDVTLPAHVVEEAFAEANPALSPPMMTVTCAAGRIDEIRICLTKDLHPRACAPDTARDCRMPDALMEAVR